MFYEKRKFTHFKIFILTGQGLLTVVSCLLTEVHVEQQEIEKYEEHNSHLAFKNRLE